MSQIKLVHSGGNGVIISAPSSNPAANRTLTLPGDADGEILTSNSSVGKILQVVTTTTNAAASYSITNAYENNSSNIYYLTALDTVITTTVANSKILISGSVFGESSAEDHRSGFVLSSELGGTLAPIDSLRGASNGNRGRMTSMMTAGYFSTNQDTTPSITHFTNLIYAPSQSAGIDITIRVGAVCTQSSKTFYLNRTVANGNAYDEEVGVSNITLMEVAA